MTNIIEEFGAKVLSALLSLKDIDARIADDAANIGKDLADFTPSPIEITEAEIVEIQTNIRKARELNDLAAALIPLAGKVALMVLAPYCPVAAASLATSSLTSSASDCVGDSCKTTPDTSCTGTTCTGGAK